MSIKSIKEKYPEIIPVIYDPTFKAVFTRENPEITADFLKAFLSIPEEEYDYIEFADPQRNRNHVDDKLCIIDLLIYTKSKKIIHVEMQMEDKRNFKKRAIYYNSDLLVEQLKNSQNYDTLEKTISILIVDFEMFESPRYIRKINYRCEDGELFDDVTEFHVLEIPKVPKEFDGTKLCEWAKFFSSRKVEEFDLVAEKNPEIKKAVGVLREFSEDEANRLAIKKIEKMRRDRVAEIQFGRDKGLEIGREEGMAVGLAEGSEKKSVEIAKKMLKDNLAVDFISNYTGLSIETIQSLKSELEV